jgi:acyl-CoA reductase-like NAD-dependent aldehyde dehydrogenase
MREAVHAQASYLRRQAAIGRISERLRSQPEVPDEERDAVLQAIADAHRARAEQLGDGSAR